MDNGLHPVCRTKIMENLTDITGVQSSHANISNSFTVDHTFDKRKQEFMKTQLITKLELRANLLIGRRLFPQSNNTDRSLGINLPETLVQLLNPRSLAHLEELSIFGKYLDFSPNWAGLMFQQLPSISSLDLNLCPVTNADFSVMCSSLGNLKKLNISRTDVTNLEGIRKLKGLEVLHIVNLRFERKENLQELAQLPYLRVLDMSVEKKVSDKNFEYFMESDLILHELQLIDISGNRLPLSLLERLVKNHKNLMQVNIIQTGVGNNQSLFLVVKFLTLDNFTHTLEALEYYMAPAQNDKIDQILLWHIVPKMNGASDVMLEKCFLLLTKLFQNENLNCGSYYLIHGAIVSILQERRMQFRSETINKLFYVLREMTCKKYILYGGFIHQPIRHAHIAAFNIFKLIVMKYPSTKYIDQVCLHLCSYIGNGPSEKKVYKKCLFVLLENILMMSPEASKLIHKDDLLLNRLKESIKNEPNMSYQDEGIDTIILILTLNQKSTHECRAVTNRHFMQLLVHIYADKPKRLVTLFKMFAQHFEKETLIHLFQMNRTRFFMRHLKSFFKRTQEVAASLLFTLFIHHQGKLLEGNYMDCLTDCAANYVCTILSDNEEEFVSIHVPAKFYGLLVSKMDAPLWKKFRDWISQHSK